MTDTLGPLLIAFFATVAGVSVWIAWQRVSRP